MHHMGSCRIARDYIRRQELKKNEKDRAKPSGFIDDGDLKNIFYNEGAGKPGDEIEGGEPRVGGTTVVDTDNGGDIEMPDAAQKRKERKKKKKGNKKHGTTVVDTDNGDEDEEKNEKKRTNGGTKHEEAKKHKTNCKFPKVGSLRSSVGGKRLVFLIT